MRVGFGDLHIKHRLTQRLILGENNLAGFIFIAGSQAGSLAGFGVHTVKSSAANAATNQTVTCFHRIFHATAKIKKTDPEALKGNEWFTLGYAYFATDTKFGVRFDVRCGHH